MMQLTSVTVIKNLTAKTDNANYQIEQHVVSGNLQRFSVTAFSTDGEQFLGSINLENGTTSCSFPTTARLTPYFDDFDGFVAEIKAEVENTPEP